KRKGYSYSRRSRDMKTPQQKHTRTCDAFKRSQTQTATLLPGSCNNIFSEALGARSQSLDVNVWVALLDRLDEVDLWQLLLVHLREDNARWVSRRVVDHVLSDHRLAMASAVVHEQNAVVLVHVEAWRVGGLDVELEGV